MSGNATGINFDDEHNWRGKVLENHNDSVLNPDFSARTS